MKGDVKHVVPLSDAAINVLKSLPRVVGSKGFVFSTTGKSSVGGYSRAKTRLDAAMERVRREAAGLPRRTIARRAGRRAKSARPKSRSGVSMICDARLRPAWRGSVSRSR